MRRPPATQAEFLLVGFWKIPFACSYLPGQTNLPVRFLAYWFAFTTYGYTMATLERWMLQNPADLALFYLLAVTVLAGLVACRNRLIGQGVALIFEEEAEPVVRTLNLSGGPAVDAPARLQLLSTAETPRALR